jgi:GNAT superfamily N-acetyltransferase
MTRQPATPVEIRAATADDTTAIRAVWAANGDDVPEGGVDIVAPYLAHLLATGRVLVAVDGRRVIGFAATVERVGVSHLADLFVLPDRFGQGTGKRLTAAVFGDTRRRTTFASADPRALPLYVRSGMTPLWPNLYLEADSSSLPPPPAGAEFEPAGPDALADLEQSWLGSASLADHHFWAALPESRPFVVHSAGRPVALVHARARRSGRGRSLGRLILAPGADPAPVVLVALHHAAEGGIIGSSVPGPSPALRPLLEAGARITDRDTFLASHAGLFDPTRRISDGGIL